MQSRINFNLQDYTIIHEKNYIHTRKKISYFFVCEHPETHEFVTFNGKLNKINSFARRAGFILELHDVSFFNSIQDAFEHESIWEEKLTDCECDILHDVIEMEINADEYRTELFEKNKELAA
ncbi:MAG: hypothetical protein ABR980_08815 [Ignavibacteriaceae bacterium]|jgi:hypothetical protein